MILTKSPYYLSIPWTSSVVSGTVTKFILHIFVWKGDKATGPGLPTYEEESVNPLGLTAVNKVNISPYINDVLTVSTNQGNNTSIINGECAVWVKTRVVYYIDGVAIAPEYTATDLAVRGYGYGIEGENTSIPSNGVLSDFTNVNVSSQSKFMLHFKISQYSSTDISIISFPDNNINLNTTIALTTSSIQMIKKAFVNCSEAGTDTYIEIKKGNALVHTLNIKEELRYTPFDCFFVNKQGALYPITFFKEKVTSLKVSSENFESSNGQASGGVHQNATYNKNGVTSFKAKTGFISESNNDLIKQLLLSEKVWILEGAVFNPVNVASSSIEYKSRQKDRLLDYEIDFTFAYNEINNQ